MTEKTYVVVEINKDNETHKFPCEVVKLNESEQTMDVKFKDGIIYNNVPYSLVSEGVGDLWNKIKSGAKKIGARFKKIGSDVVAFVNGVVAAALSPLQSAFNFQRGILPKGVVVIPSDDTIQEAKEHGISLKKDLKALDSAEDNDAFIQSLNEFWSLIKEQHDARGGQVSESEIRAIYWNTLSARRKMQLNEGILKPADIIMPISVNQEQIDLINTGIINEGYLFESEELDDILGITNKRKVRRAGVGNDNVPPATLQRLKSKKWSEIPDVYYDELVDMLKSDMLTRISTPFEDEINKALDGVRPILIWGAPAIGKTSIVKQLINSELPEENLNMISLTASMLYRDDFMLPSNTNDSSEDIPKSWLPCYRMVECQPEERVEVWGPLNDIANGANNGRSGGIIFVDEFSRVTPDAMTVFMTLVQERELNSKFRLGSKWMFVMAANRAEDMEGGENVQAGQTFTWDSAWSGRFEHVNYVPEFEVWLEWAEKNGIEKILIDFIKSNPKYWFDILDHASDDTESSMDELKDTGVQLLRSDQRAIADADKTIKSQRNAKRRMYAAQEMVNEWKEKANKLLNTYKEEARRTGTEVDYEAFKKEAYDMIPWQSKQPDINRIRVDEIEAWLETAPEEFLKRMENIDITSDVFTKRVQSHMGTTAGRAFDEYLRFYRFFPEEYGRMVWIEPDKVPLEKESIFNNLTSMLDVIIKSKPEPKDKMEPDDFYNIIKFALRIGEVNPTALTLFITYLFGKHNYLVDNYVFGDKDNVPETAEERNLMIRKVYDKGLKLLASNNKTNKQTTKTLSRLLSDSMTDSFNREVDKEEAKLKKKK